MPSAAQQFEWNGLDENVLLQLLKRIDGYTYVNDDLQLMQGNHILLRFKKDDQDTSLM